jgi:type I restriction enzyme R subunit
MNDILLEKNFEQCIEDYLVNEGGYEKGDPTAFNRKTALDEATLLDFIKTTQANAWERFVKNHGANAEAKFIQEFSKEVKSAGLLYVLRHGFKDRGVAFKVCYFKPESTLNPTTVQHYAQNTLHCTRQLRYSVLNENSIDMVLFLNGIPVISLELKCQFTGQDKTNAINQYKFDRNSKDKIFEFKERVLVHFAVDLYDVYMTTRLSGAGTYFLPFNQGSNGAGNVGGKGNPLVEDGFQTEYLWKNVLSKDRLMEILHKFIHLQKEKSKDKNGKTKTKETMIFPRYHQLDVVSKLLADVKTHGSGKNYLIQHSAGSGKSNSIAWLAHRLGGLHNADNEKIFNSVLVVTDRKILDSQLQDTIFQFDHINGVVERIDKNAKQLLEAINSNTPVIITTLQKFPVIYKAVQSTNKRFAVIVDEAHSSQTGESAQKLKKALGDTEHALEAYAKMEADAEAQTLDAEDHLVKELMSHGPQDNLSFFAFTATPKAKTLQTFGEKQEDGTYKASHTYSMKQAIEEGFILDVLKNYVTYNTYYKIAKNIPEDPELIASKGAKAISRFESLHPHNLSQKTAIIIEHFREITKNKIEGKAKAMVVTASRLHAVRYLFEFRKYIESQGYSDLDVLVAFSGSIKENEAEWTEEKINKTKNGETIREYHLKEAFHGEEFHMLIVAEKYQTGFDEPLLHTMFVDKKLNGVKAVQTLSRLNRITRGKDDTFVLDFMNTPEDIKEAFQPFYEGTLLDAEIDPNLVYSYKRTLDDFRVYQVGEVEHFSRLYYSKAKQGIDQGRLSACLKPTCDRYDALEEEQKDALKTALFDFLRTYSFIIQVCRIYDKDLQTFYVFAKYLAKILPKDNSEKVNLEDKVLLEYFKLTKATDGSIVLENQEGMVHAPKGGGAGQEKETKALSLIIEKFNEKFGTGFTEQDKVLEQLKADMKKDARLSHAGKVQDKTLFRTLCVSVFKNVLMERYGQNDRFFTDLLADEEKLVYIEKILCEDLYKELGKSI